MHFNQSKPHIPNLLTIGRLFLFIISFVLLFSSHYRWSLLLFIVAVVTDFFDGKLARMWKVTSAFGERYDPLIDKIGVLLSLAFFTVQYQINALYYLVIFTRELVITIIREKKYTNGEKMPADMHGKIKTNLQFLLVSFFYFANIGWLNPSLLYLEAVYLVVSSYTAWSGLNYLQKLGKN